MLLVANGVFKEFSSEHAKKLLGMSNNGGWVKATASQKKSYEKGKVGQDTEGTSEQGVSEGATD